MPVPGYLNPVHDAPFPDPMVLDVGGAHRDYYAYATGGGFPILHSTDLVSWRAVGTAFERRPDWVVERGDWHPWAPSVLEAGGSNGRGGRARYLLYYVGLRVARPELHCVGVAVADDPAGPFTDLGPLELAPEAGDDGADGPIGCGDAAGFSNIDPAPFVDDDGRGWLYLSTGMAPGSRWPWRHARSRPTISVVRLSDDLTRAAGPRAALFAGERGGWERAPWASVVENPWMERRGSTYVLFYSGGAWDGRYGMGYAVGPSPVGPFAKAPENPILADTDTVRSAGGGSLVTGPRGGTWVAYHGRAGSLREPRTLRIDPVHWDAEGRPWTEGPTHTPQSRMP